MNMFTHHIETYQSLCVYIYCQYLNLQCTFGTQLPRYFTNYMHVHVQGPAKQSICLVDSTNHVCIFVRQ